MPSLCQGFWFKVFRAGASLRMKFVCLFSTFGAIACLIVKYYL
nr:MAG TPA: hypothetical protein [Microviridae sp.]